MEADQILLWCQHKSRDGYFWDYYANNAWHTKFNILLNDELIYENITYEELLTK